MISIYDKEARTISLARNLGGPGCTLTLTDAAALEMNLVEQVKHLNVVIAAIDDAFRCVVITEPVWGDLGQDKE